MDVYGRIDLFFTAINQIMDRVAPFALGLLALGVVAGYTRGRIRKEGLGKALYLGAIALLEAGFLVAVIYLLPAYAARFIGFEALTTALRWIFLYAITGVVWFSTTYETSGWRGVTFVLSLLTAFLLGWAYHRWIGIIAISVPLILAFFHIIYQVAQVVYPASDPESRQEAREKFRAFIMYLLGLQHPIWVAEAKAGRDYDKRIPGDTRREIGRPGIVWTWSHQVAAISSCALAPRRFLCGRHNSSRLRSETT